MKKRTVLAVLLVLAIGLTTALFRPRKSEFVPQSFTLKDGSQITIVGVTHGTNHFWSERTVFEHLKKFLPRSLRGNLSPELKFDSERPQLVLWTHWTGMMAASRLPQVAIEDEQGIWSSLNYLSEHSSSKGGLTKVSGIRLRTFPRHGTNFVLHFFENSSNSQKKELAAIRMKTPQPLAVAAWKAEALPATKTDDDLSVTLNRVVANVDQNDSEKPVLSTEPWRARTLLELSVTHQGAPGTNWTVSQVACSDMGGNQDENTSMSTFTQNNMRSVTINSILWPGQSPWKLRIELSRNAAFAADEILELKSIPVILPTPGQRYVRQEGRLQGFHVEVYDADYYLQNPPDGPSRGYELRFKTTPPLKDRRFTAVHVENERGQSYRTSGWSSSGNGEYSLSVVGTNAAKTLSATLAIHKSRYVDFIVKPDVRK